MSDAALAIPGAMSETSLVLPEGLSFEEWEAVGSTLKRVEKSVRWWIGDWMTYGERAYGETYSQAIEVTGRSYQDLADMAYVSKAIQFSERSENLTWSHHKEVAPLEPIVRSAWLVAAEDNDWSTRELREQIKTKQQNVAPRLPKCSRCGEPCKICRIDLKGE